MNKPATMERVLPRDAFNDGNLLKCIGMLTMAIEDGFLPNWTYEFDGEAFDIQMSEDDGSTWVDNIHFSYKKKRIAVSRPLNSRQSWPLTAIWADEEQDIFNEKGEVIFK